MSRTISNDALKSYKADAAPSAPFMPKDRATPTSPDVRAAAPAPVFHTTHVYVAPPYVPYYSHPFAGGVDPTSMWMAFELANSHDREAEAYMRGMRDTEAYREWRRSADLQAASNPDLRAKLARADEITPIDSRTASHEGHAFLYTLLAIVVVAGGGAAAYVILVRRRLPAAKTATPKGVNEKDDSMRFSQPALRVGQVVSIDPTPFILLGSKIPTLKRIQGKHIVERLDDVRFNGTRRKRLWIAEDAFLEVFGDTEVEREVRLFTLFESVEPTTSEEWGVWLDADGILGHPTFTPKAGGTPYDRVWGQGSDGHVPPVAVTGTGTDGTETIRIDDKAMLYARPTDAGGLSPKTEFLLIEVVEQATESAVRLWTGIDLSADTLDPAA